METQPQQPLSDDPLARLHKMSTTAGLGVGEYVAINPMSVAALVVGLASAMAMLDPILLAIPVVALVLGLIAFRQIKKGGGTQKGYVLVALGVVASIAFAGIVGTHEVIFRPPPRRSSRSRGRRRSPPRGS